MYKNTACRDIKRFACTSKPSVACTSMPSVACMYKEAHSLNIIILCKQLLTILCQMFLTSLLNTQIDSSLHYYAYFTRQLFFFEIFNHFIARAAESLQDVFNKLRYLDKTFFKRSLIG